MKYRRLGRSGLQVSELSFGSWMNFTNRAADDVNEKCMKYAYDHGVNFFDNAEGYNFGESEKLMGKILKKMKWHRDSYAISSKVFFGGNGKLPMQIGLSRKHVFDACHDALKRMRIEYLDLYFCHRPDPETPIDETVWAMHQLIMQGKILYWGTSEWSANELKQAFVVAERHNLIPPTMEQPQYNLLMRDKVENEFVPLYAKGLGTTIWSPLASGLLTGKYINSIPKNSRLGIKNMEWLKKKTVEDDSKMEKVKKLSLLCEKIGVPMNQLAIAWCLKNKNVSTVILGASKLDQLKSNLKSLEVYGSLNEDVMKELDKITLAKN
ncbi:MAG TPA: aldo/keto reductase [Bacteroidetes bacterium]|nr:aldo/keto reductase [Bacteroidota bacterium]